MDFLNSIQGGALFTFGTWAIIIAGLGLIYKIVRKELDEHRKEGRRQAREERREAREERKRFEEVLDSQREIGRLSRELEASDKINQATYRMLKIAGFEETDSRQGTYGFRNEAKPDNE